MVSGPGELFSLEIEIFSLLDSLFLTVTVKVSGSSSDDLDLMLSSFSRLPGTDDSSLLRVHNASSPRP